MRVSSRDFIGLPVRTFSGTDLGKVSGFELLSDTGHIVTVFVKTKGLFGLIDHELSVAWSQVRECTNEYLIVDDAVFSKEKERAASLPGVSLSAKSATEGIMQEEGS